MKDTKILIASPAKVDEPLGVMYLSSALKNAGFQVRGVLINKEDVFKVFDEYDPDIVLYSVITGEHLKCLSVNEKLKEKKEFVSVFGGPHVTFAPDFINNNGVDVIGIGECEEAIVELIVKLSQGKDITRVKNFWIKKNNKLYKNEVRPLNSDLDTIDFPDRELFAKGSEDGEICVMTSRGCFYKCTYCHNKALKDLYSNKGRFCRLRSIDNILREIKQIKGMTEIKTINFHDDIFFQNSVRLKDFSERFKKEISIPFICSLRPEFVTGEKVRLLKEAGCQKVFLGVEAGDDTVRKNLLKRNITKKQMLDARDLLKKYDITVFAQNIIGFPNTTISHDIETLKFNIELKPDFAWVSIFTPYPATDLGKLCAEEGLIDNFDGVYDTYHYKSPLKIVHKPQVDVLHKLFSLIVDYPELLPALKKMLTKPEKCNFKELQEIFVLFREFKYEKVNRGDLELPDKVKDFIKGLAQS